MKVTQSCLALCDPVDYTVHGILQARILEWVAIPFSGGSSLPRDQTQVSRIAGDSLPAEPQGKPKNTGVGSLSLLQGIFPTQELNQGLLHCRWILWAIREAQRKMPFGEFCKHRAIFFPLPPHLYSVNIDWTLKYVPGTILGPRTEQWTQQNSLLSWSLHFNV